MFCERFLTLHDIEVGGSKLVLVAGLMGRLRPLPAAEVAEGVVERYLGSQVDGDACTDLSYSVQPEAKLP